MGKNENDEFFGKNIENFSFFYPLSQIWKISSLIRKIVFVLGIISVLGIGFITYAIVYNKLVEQNSSIVFIFGIVVVLVLLSIVAIIYILFDKCRFKAGIYSKGIEIEMGGRLFSELKGVKMFQYNENGYEYVKLIYTEYDDIITTETLLYNPKMDKFLEKFQKTLKNHEITCEKISDIRGIDISDPIEYKVYFWFLNVWRLLSGKEKWEKVKGFCVAYLCALIALSFGVFYKRFSIVELKTSMSIFFVMAGVLLVFIIIYFIIAIKKFYARKENNTVCIHNTVLSKTYVLSKIDANYGFITEGNIEGTILTIEEGSKKTIYKRPKNREVERFCNDLLIEIQKRKKI